MKLNLFLLSIIFFFSSELICQVKIQLAPITSFEFYSRNLITEDKTNPIYILHKETEVGTWNNRFGININLEFEDGFGLVTGLHHFKYGFIHDHTDPIIIILFPDGNSESREYTTSAQYFNALGIPLNLKYTWSLNKLSLFIEGGFSINMNYKNSFVNSKDDETVNSSEFYYRDFFSMGNFGFGISKRINEIVSFSIKPLMRYRFENQVELGYRVDSYHFGMLGRVQFDLSAIGED